MVKIWCTCKWQGSRETILAGNKQKCFQIDLCNIRYILDFEIKKEKNTNYVLYNLYTVHTFTCKDKEQIHVKCTPNGEYPNYIYYDQTAFYHISIRWLSVLAPSPPSLYTLVFHSEQWSGCFLYKMLNSKGHSQTYHHLKSEYKRANIYCKITIHD